MGDVIKIVFAQADSPVLIAVGGPGGTGKSWLAGLLADQLGDASVLRLDDYKTARTDRGRAGIFGPHPDANKMDLIAEHLTALQAGRTISKPVYDPSIGDAATNEEFQPAKFVLVDGEVSTYRRFRNTIDFAVFIDSDWRTQLATRLGRDLSDRNYSTEKAVATFLNSNLREFGDHGAESKNWSDAHIFCHTDYRLELESVSRELYEQMPDRQDAAAVPLPTPFDAGIEIDHQAFVEHLDTLIDTDPDQRPDLLQLAFDYFSDQSPGQHLH